MMGPGEDSLTPMARTSSTGQIISRMRLAMTTSLMRLPMPETPRVGDSVSATTGMPWMWSTRAWIRSETKMSGTK